MGPTAIETETGTNSVTFAAATPQNWRLVYAHVTFVASADVGNRAIVMELLNGSSVVVGDWHCIPAVAASQTRHIEFTNGFYREAVFAANNTIQTSFPAGMTIPDGYTLRIRDSAEISETDSITAYIQVEKSAA